MIGIGEGTARLVRGHALAGAAVVLVSSALGGCGGDLTEEEPLIRPVRTQEIVSTGGDRTRSFSGAARAGQESRLSFKVTGTIEELAVKVGDEVAPGALIARLDPIDLQLRLQDAEASRSRLVAEARQADANYRRTMQLYENRSASKADLDAARAAAEASTAAVTSAEQTVALARRNLDYARLTAPLAGAISDVPAEVGENVNAGATVAVLSSGALPEVTCSMPEALIADVREGDEVEVSFDAIPDSRFAAIVTEVGINAGSTGGVYLIVARLTQPTQAVRAGMAAEVFFRFRSGDERERVYVPAFAVLEDGEGRFAFIAEPSGDGRGTIRRRAVEVGELTATGLEIKQGLTDGDLLVTAGVTKIRDGQVVRLPDRP